MKARIIIPTANGGRLNYELRLHHGSGRDELKIVFNTNEEAFEPWLFFLLRDIGAHIVTNDPRRLRAALRLGHNESGISSLDEAGDATKQIMKV